MGLGRTMAEHQTEQRGITLIEMLLALAVFSIILAVLYSTFFVSNRAVAGLDEYLVRLHEARTALDIIGREIESSFKSGKGSSLTLKDRDIFGRQASEVSFTTFFSPLPGAARVSYYVQEAGEGLVLVKRIGPAWADEDGGEEASTAEDIVSFTAEAWNGGKWLRTWKRGTAPEVLRITLTVDIGGRSLSLAETIKG